MKAHNIIKSILALSLAVVSVTSCQEKINGGRGFTKGEAVKFSVGSAGSSLDTKAAYSGATSDGIERIDWQEGDLIRIYCDAVSEPLPMKYADYKVSEVLPSTTEVSKAHIVGTGGVGLRWGEGVHYFHGVAPATTIAKNSESLHVIATGNIKSPQTPGTVLAEDVSVAAGDTCKIDADMTNMFMAAKAGPYSETGKQADDDGVFLSFTPLTTAIEFTITNDTGASIPIKSVSLISGYGKTSAEPVIKGDFSIDLDNWAKPEDAKPADGSMTVTYGREYPACTGIETSANEADRTVTIDFGKVITLAAKSGDTKGGSLTFTFMITPTHDFEDLTFKFTKSDDSWMSTKLGYTDGTGVFFPRHKKTKVTGIMVPEGTQWTVNYGSAGDDAVTTLTSWKTGVTGTLDLGGGEPVQWINLGLPSGTLWADRNLGAESETEPGDHYAWGETNAHGTAATAYPSYWTGGTNDTYSALTAKTKYDMSSYKWFIGATYAYPYAYLHPEDDIASVLIKSASTPNIDQWKELVNKCDITKEGNGWWLQSRINGERIYIPANGYYNYNNEDCTGENIGRTDMGHYWSNKKDASIGAYRFGIEDSKIDYGRYHFHAGMGIRPVKARPTDASLVTFIDLGLPSGNLWAEVNLGATAKTGWGSIGKFYSFGETNAYGEPVSPYPADWTGATNPNYLALSNKTAYLDATYYKWNGTDRYNSGFLKPEDDAATVLLGQGCKVPSSSDWEELLDNCNITRETIDGITYCKFTSKISGYTDKSILLPYAGLVDGSGVISIGGEGDYWTSNVVTSTDKSSRFRIDNENVVILNDMPRTYGVTIRAVKPRPVHD